MVVSDVEDRERGIAVFGRCPTLSTAERSRDVALTKRASRPRSEREVVGLCVWGRELVARQDDRELVRDWYRPG